MASLFMIIFLLFNVAPFFCQNQSVHSSRALQEAFKLQDFEVLGSCFDFDSGVRTTISVDVFPYLYYPYHIKIFNRSYSILKAHNLKYMAYLAFCTLETNYENFIRYYGLEDIERRITGVNIEGGYFRYSEPNYEGWPTRGFTSRSLWREILTNMTRLTFDAGADMVVYDIGWGTVPSALAGEMGDYGDAALYCFDEESIIGFREYLKDKYNPEELKEKFGISDISSFNFTAYLRERGYTKNSDIEKIRYENQSPENEVGDQETKRLWREFEKYHLKATLNFYDELCSDLKSRAANENRNFWIAANLKPTLSYHYSEGMMSIVPFLAHLDFPYFEVFYDDLMYPMRNPSPIFRTIFAAGKHFAVMTTPAPSISDFFKSDNPHPEEQDLATAEVIACGGWPQTTLHNLTYIRLVETHPEILPKEGDGQIALIYSLPSALNLHEYYPEEPWGYLPFESAYYLLSDMKKFSFDIIILGDKEFFVRDPSLDELLKYKALILPDASCLTDDQAALLMKYTSHGGILVGFGSVGSYDENGFPVKNREITRYFVASGSKERIINSYGKGKIISIGQAFLTEYYTKRRDLYEHYQGYTGEGSKRLIWINETIGPLLNWFEKTLISAGLQPDISTNLHPFVNIIKYFDPKNKAMIIHLINYEYDFKGDRVLTQTNVSIAFTLRPEFKERTLKVRFYSPDESDGIVLESFTDQNGRLRLTIPKLHVWGVLRIEEERPEIQPYTINAPAEIKGEMNLNRSLIVNSTLTISNALINIRSPPNGYVKIEVLKGGELRIINSTLRRADESSRYYIRIDGGRLFMKDSIIDGAGIWGPLERGGVWIKTKEAILLNCEFRNCYQYGLFLMETNYTLLKDCRFRNCIDGLMMYETHFIKVINCSFLENSIGIYAKHAYNLDISRCSFRNNRIFGCLIERGYFPLVRDSFFSGSRWDGLSFLGSIFARVVNCTSKNNGVGFSFQNTPVSTLLNSDSINNSLSGVLLWEENMWSITPPRLMLGYIDMPWISLTSEIPYPLRGDYLPCHLIRGDRDGKVLILRCNIQGNWDGITLGRLFGFNGHILIINNTIIGNSVGLNLYDATQIVVVGNNIMNNEIQAKLRNLRGIFYGNYWGRGKTGPLNLTPEISDEKPLKSPNKNVEDIPDANSPSISILERRWEENGNLKLKLKIVDDTSLLADPQDELIWINLIKPRPIEDADYWAWFGIFNKTYTYAVSLPREVDNPRCIIMNFQTDFFADLSRNERRFIKIDVYASDAYGNWGVMESEAPHIIPIKAEGRVESAEFSAVIFEQSELKEAYLLYMTEGKEWNRSDMHYDEKNGFFKAEVKDLPNGTIKFKVKIVAEDIYGNRAETKVQSYILKIHSPPTIKPEEKKIVEQHKVQPEENRTEIKPVKKTEEKTPQTRQLNMTYALRIIKLR